MVWTSRLRLVACLVLMVMLGAANACGAAAKPAAALPPDAKFREADAITRTTILSCPELKPAFDHARIDRTLKEPKYASEKPAYRFFAFGPEGKHILAMVLDESQGTGKGYDVLYVDLNLDRDITADDEKFICAKPVTPAKSVAPKPLECGTLVGEADCPAPDAVNVALAAATWIINPVLPDAAPLKRQLDVPDPMFDYFLECLGSKWLVRCEQKAGDWHTRLAMYGSGNVWSWEKAAAPVYRFGGTDWSFRHDHLRGRTFKVGEPLVIEATTPFFAGSSPVIPFRQAGCWVYGGYVHARYSLESLERPSEANRIFFAGSTCCGGSHISRILIPADMPPGKAELVLSMDTPDAYLGRVVQRIPVTIDNPGYGKPIAELPLTRELGAQFPGDTVVELFQGADLSAWGLGKYDGARDVYMTDIEATGGAQSQGSALSYSYDCRNDLRVGTLRTNRTLLRFDLSMIPRDARIKKAMLRMFAADLKPKVDRTTRVCVLKKKWHDDLCNGQVAISDQSLGWFGAWYYRMPFPVGQEVKWEKPLAMGDSDRVQEPIGSIAFAEVGWDGLDITAAAQQWVNGDLANHGIVMELSNPQNLTYAIDVNMVSSENPSFPDRRPRLVLVLEKGFKPAAAPAIEERNADFEKARAQAKADGKLLVCNILSAKSPSCWTFQQTLKNPEVEAFLAKRFVEVRLDADKPEHRKLLDFYGVKYSPTALVIRPGATPEQDVFERFEPLRWNTRFGWSYTMLESPESYTLHLEWLRTKGSARMPWRRLSDGTIYRLDSHLFYQRFDGNGGMILAK